LRQVVALGLAQGPSEVLPVSSSAHIALIPQLAGWPHAGLDPELRNSLEVALHAGTAAALLAYLGIRAKRASPEAAALRGGLSGAPARSAADGLDGRTLGRALATAALALAPPVLVGYLLERRPEQRPSSPRVLAAGLVLGGAAMALADLRRGTRTLADAGPGDGLALGLAQALALLPGVSRNGATLTAARARRFTREDAQALSWRAGLPVIAGAAGLKAHRLLQRGAPAGALAPLAVGATASFLSTLASAPLIRQGRRARALWPFALYRGGLALAAVRTTRASARTHATAATAAATSSTEGQAPIAKASR
jgi:undecaprenyl-diphosphatase